MKERAVLALSNSRLIAGPAYFENEINFYELKAKKSKTELTIVQATPLTI